MKQLHHPASRLSPLCSLLLLCAVGASGQQQVASLHDRQAKPIPEALLKRLTQSLLLAAKPRLAFQKETSPPDKIIEATVEGEVYYGRTGTVSWSVTTDIQPIASAKSPYQGLVIHTMEKRAPPKYTYPTREEARSAPLTKIVYIDQISTFLYQNGKWIYQGEHKGPLRQK